ncbi:MAG TPA: L,D-transpeptidase family protein [Anaerolineales bacterium]|nr:L,D-transpeptidase family protein [Anaerolineales bacterium]
MIEARRTAYPARTPGVRSARAGFRLHGRAMGIGLAVLGAMAFAPVALVFGLYGAFLMRDVVAPGVHVRDLSLENMRLEEATITLDRVWNQELRLTAVDMADMSRTWQAGPGNFGVRVDASATAQQAYGVGRSGNVLERMSSLYEATVHGREVEPVILFDAQTARMGLGEWAVRVDVLAVDGWVEIRGATVASAPGVAGVELDVEATLSMLAASPGAILEYRLLPLVTEPVLPAIGDVGPAAAEAERLLGTALSLHAYDPVRDEHFNWSPAPEVRASWLRVDSGPGQIMVSVDGAMVEAYVTEQIASLGGERSLAADPLLALARSQLEGGASDAQLPLIVEYLPTSRVVGAGETIYSIAAQIGMPFWRLQESNPVLKTRGVVPGETIVIPPRDANLELPVVPNKRIVVSIAEQRLWAFEGGQAVREEVISTGIASSPTLPGVFQIKSRYLEAYASRWDLWMPHFLGIYDAVPGFENGFHGLPLLSNGVRLWARVLGRPVSYGCIVLTLEAAEWLYNWAEDGVVVEIQR